MVLAFRSTGADITMRAMVHGSAAKWGEYVGGEGGSGGDAMTRFGEMVATCLVSVRTITTKRISLWYFCLPAGNGGNGGTVDVSAVAARRGGGGDVMVNGS